MAFFWLQDDDSNTLDLDDTVQELTLGGNGRGFSVISYLGANGGSIRGWGSYTAKEFIVSRKEKAETGDGSAWNSRRSDFIKWFTRPRYKNIWLYIRNGEDTFTVRTKVFCEEIPDDKYKFYRISDSRAFKLISPSGVFEDITATTGTEVFATSVIRSEIAVINGGTIDAPAIFSYTPTATSVVFKVTLYDNFGFTLTVTDINSGDKISYNTANGSLTIAGVTRNPAQFLTSGSLFNLQAGESNIYVSASEAGTFDYSFNARYI
jgi:hypothetical protein